MTKKKVIKIAIALGVIVLLLLTCHLVGSTLFPMMKSHFGL